MPITFGQKLILSKITSNLIYAFKFKKISINSYKAIKILAKLGISGI